MKFKDLKKGSFFKRDKDERVFIKTSKSYARTFANGKDETVGVGYNEEIIPVKATFDDGGIEDVKPILEKAFAYIQTAHHMLYGEFIHADCQYGKEKA